VLGGYIFTGEVLQGNWAVLRQYRQLFCLKSWPFWLFIVGYPWWSTHLLYTFTLHCSFLYLGRHYGESVCKGEGRGKRTQKHLKTKKNFF